MLSTVNFTIPSNLFILTMNFFLFFKREIYIRNDHLKWALESALIVPSARKKAGISMARGFRDRPSAFDFGIAKIGGRKWMGL